MRTRHPKKRPRSHEARDCRTSPYSLLSKLPISESLEERHVTSTGITRTQQRKLDRKNKRKRKSNAFRPHHDNGEQASGIGRANSASISSPSKGGHPKDSHLESTVPRKRRKPNRAPASDSARTPTTKQTVTNNDRKPEQPTVGEDALVAAEDPDSREIRRLERLLGIPKRKASSRTTGRYDGIFDETETDILDLVRSCDQTLNRRFHAMDSDHAEEGLTAQADEGGQDSESEEGSDDAYVGSLQSAEEEGISESKHSETDTPPMTHDDSQEDVPYVAKWKRSDRGGSRNKTPSQFSVKALQGLLNRVSASNTADIAKKIASLYPKDMSAGEQGEVASSYAEAVLEAINQGNTMGSTNPYLRAHVEVVFILGTTVDMTLLAKFVTTTIIRLRASLESDSEPTLSEPALRMSHIFGYIVSLCAVYELGALPSGFMYETLMWIAEPLCKTRLDAELKLLQEAGPLLRRKDPAAFANVVRFVHGQAEQNGADEDAKSSSNETSCKLSMLTDIVENIRNNRIKVMKGISQKIETTCAYLPFQAPLTQLLDYNYTSTRWWDNTRQNKSARESPGDGHRRTIVDADRDTSRISRLAAALRLHTDARRGLLTAVMTSASCPDAIHRIYRLGTFTSKQKLKDLTYIISHCCRSEQPYNKFYALLANRVCQKSREARFAMEFTIQDAIKGTNCGDREDGLGRKTKNLACYLGDLWASEGLPLSMLRRIPDLEDISEREQNFYTASFERMVSQRKAESVDPSAPFTRLKRETVRGGDLFCSSLAIFLRRHVHPKMSGTVQSAISKAMKELERNS